MKVKFASQVFSKTVAAVMETCMLTGDLSGEVIHTIDFINSMDNLFDIFNSRPITTEINIEEEPSNYICF